MRKTNRVILFSVLSLMWGLFIFSQSMKTGAVSEQMSLGVVAWIAQFLHIDAELLHVLVRKGAHFSEYMLLGVLLSLTMRAANLLPRRFDLTVLFIGTIWAALDEFLQTFIPDRSGQVSDVLLDVFGVLCGFLLVLLIVCLRHRRKKEESLCSV